MANTIEMLRLMRHHADLLDGTDPMANARLGVVGTTTRTEAFERAAAELVAVRSAATILRMVAAALDDEVVPDA